MRVLHVDFETTGLYLKGEPSENPNQPHPCSVSAILDDEHGKMLASFYSLINVPPGTVWEPKAFEANGLTEQQCNRYGAPLLDVMNQMHRMAKNANAFCAFSAYFDLKFVKIGCARIGTPGALIRETFEGLTRMCTMETSARYLNGEGQRFIKLVLAHKQIMGREFEGAHNALYDNMAQRAIYQRLIEKGVTDFSDTKVLRTGDSATPARTSKPSTPPAAKSASVKPTKAGKPGGLKGW
jgi:DNA polymerase III epsilon subunit-like protein